jgi:hypothetical protein
MEELTAFVKESLRAGIPRADIRAALLAANWPGDEVEDALSRYADLSFPVPVPVRRHSGSARDAFLYFLTFVALYTSGIALGALMFGIVDHFFPDPVREPYRSAYDSDLLRWNIATLIVAFPLYFFMTQYHLRSYVTNPERRMSTVRRWLTYFTLFVAANVVIGTLIGLIGNVLGGELAARFLLKSVVALLISGGVFLFYMWDLRTGDRGSAS